MNKAFHGLLLVVAVLAVHGVSAADSFNPPYPRLGYVSWYQPFDFAVSLSNATQGAVTLVDSNRTALTDFLSAHQLVIVSGTPLASDIFAAAVNRERLCEAKTSAQFLLLGRWEASGIEMNSLSFDDTSPNSPWPFVPEWFVQEVVASLPRAVSTNDSSLPIAEDDHCEYCVPRSSGWIQDQVLILDGNHSEVVKLRCNAWDGLTNEIPLTRDEAFRPPQCAYDFGQFKYNHTSGVVVRVNTWHSWNDWWAYNMTDIGPTNADGLRWNQYRPRIIKKQFLQVTNDQGDLLLDGVELDSFNQEWFGPYSSESAVVARLDLDADGVSDFGQTNPPYQPESCFPDYFTRAGNWDNCAWATGHVSFARNMRDLWDANTNLVGHDILLSHCFTPAADYLNGESFENLPMLELSSNPDASFWKNAFDHYTYWLTNGRNPVINHIQGVGARTNFALMRLCFAFTLMGNGSFTFDTGPYQRGYMLWWFDESAVDHRGRPPNVYADPPPHRLVNIRTDLLESNGFYAAVRPGLGYLGYPLGDYVHLTNSVYRRDFERGLVIGNFSTDLFILPLERPYRTIAGVQDPGVNSGMMVTNLVLHGEDGIILLHPRYFDLDDDGLDDDWEYHYFGDMTNAAPDADPDGDGSLNFTEYIAGTNPTDSNSVFTITSLATNDTGFFVVQWSSETGRTYSVSRSTNLLLGFSGLASNLPAAPPVNTYTDAVRPSLNRFYNVEAAK